MLVLMKRRWVWNILVWYYGLLQLAHFIMNFVIIFIRPELAWQASPLLTWQQAHYLLLTSIIDFIFASPLGIVWALCYFSENQKISMRLLSRSLIVAWLTAIIYLVVLLSFHAFTCNATNIVFGLLFLPIIPLTFLILCHRKSLIF